MRRRRQQLAALAAGAALVLLGGCGSSSSDKPEGKPLPAASVSTLVQRLDEVQRRYDVARGQGKPGACTDIEDDSFPAIDSTVRELPGDVDPDVRDALKASLDRLRELTRKGCEGVDDTPTEQDTTPQEVVPTPEPTTPEPTTPEPTTPEPTTPQKAPKEEKKPKDNGNGQDPGGTVAPGPGGGGQPAPPAGGDEN